MPNEIDSKDLLIRDVPGFVTEPIEREATRQRRSVGAQLKVLLEQYATRIEARERRAAEKQAAQQQVPA